MSALDRFLESLDNVAAAGDGYRASCPVPDHGQGNGDRDPSLSVDVDDEGNVLVNCFAGCDNEAIVSSVGLTLADLFEQEDCNGHHQHRDSVQGCTLDDYAAYVKLPVRFLEGEGLVQVPYDKRPAVKMPYLNRDGERVLLTRFRVCLNGKPKVKTKKGDKHRLYGLWRLDKAREAGYVWLVEGESDCQTLWFHEEPAVGIPGAKGWKAEWAADLDGIDRLYFVVEDEAGERCREKLAATPELRERLYRVEFADAKDVSGLHKRDPEGFASRLAEARAGARSAEDWEDPAPLPDGLPPVAAFDPEMLPGPLRAWILDISERMQVPADYCAAGAVVVAASLVGRSVGIRPAQKDDWLVVPNLWGVIVGPPSAMKSPALAEIMKPLDRLVVEAREAHKAATEDHEADAAAVEAVKDGLKAHIKTAGKEAAKKDGDRSGLNRLIARLRDTETPEHPTMHRYKTNDSTVEKLTELLGENPRGLLVYRDELTGWLRSFDKQGRDTDRSFFLEGWRGASGYESDRIQRGSTYVPALCISILGGIQPGPLAAYVHEVARGGIGDDGLLQRFQLLVWPDPLPGPWRKVDRYPDTNAKNRAYAVYEALDALDPEKLGAVTDGDDAGIPMLHFSRDAQGVFDEWRKQLEADVRDEDLSQTLANHLVKYRSLMPSLALIFHLMDRVSVEEDSAEEEVGVSADAARMAATWCEYLRTHAQRLYGSAGSPAIEGARALLSRIRRGDVQDRAAVREVYHGRHWSRLSDAEEVKAGARILEEYGWLRVEKSGTGGRPTEKLRLHPSLRTDPETGA